MEIRDFAALTVILGPASVLLALLILGPSDSEVPYKENYKYEVVYGNGSTIYANNNILGQHGCLLVGTDTICKITSIKEIN